VGLTATLEHALLQGRLHLGCMVVAGQSYSRVTGHGFRATASTILNEQGFRPGVIER
jgi:hypothetical protein